MESGSLQQRPRSNSKFSLKSHKSDKSDGKKPKIDLHETDKERRKNKFTTKSTVNPNKAMIEAQPANRAVYDATTMSPIRALQHRDAYGNIITDPDAANPTRPRMERPLDTIRSFEAAIDIGYKRRTQVPQAETAPSGDTVTGYSSRRSSFHGGHDSPMNPRHSPSNGYNGSRLNSVQRSSYGHGYSPNSPGYSQSRGNGHRISSGPPYASYINSNHGVLPVHQFHESHDTVNTTGDSVGSQSTEPWGNSTDPSSENSSIDRISAANKPDTGDAYAVGPYGRGSPQNGAIMEEYGHDSRAYPQPAYPGQLGTNREQYSSAQYNGQPGSNRDLYPRGPNGMATNGMRSSMPGAPQVQQPSQLAQRNVIKLGGDSTESTYSQNGTATGKAQQSRPALERQESEKKKGWLKKRFSKG